MLLLALPPQLLMLLKLLQVQPQALLLLLSRLVAMLLMLLKLPLVLPPALPLMLQKMQLALRPMQPKKLLSQRSNSSELAKKRLRALFFGR